MKAKYDILFDWRGGIENDSNYRAIVTEQDNYTRSVKVRERNRQLTPKFWNKVVAKATVDGDLLVHIKLGDKKLPVLDVCEAQDLLALLLADSLSDGYEIVVKEKKCV